MTSRGVERPNKKGAYSLMILLLSAAVGLSACGGGTDVPKKQDNPEQGAKAESAVKSETKLLQPEELPKAMVEGRTDVIYSQFSSDFKAQVSQKDFKDMVAEFVNGASAFHEESNFLLNDLDHRIWIDPASRKGILALFDGQATIVGLQILELGKPHASDEQYTNTTFRLPFKGDWFVFWGGNNVLFNYHYEHEIQRYAYDFIQVQDGRSYQGDEKKNESYFAFGKEVLAPADGVVVTVVNDIPDNVPVGVMNEQNPAGNQVIIEHNGEYSILAHLKQGSATVKEGDTVKRGEVIGQLGNSGNSSEPHLHFQVSDGKDLFQSRAIAVKWEQGLNPQRGEIIQGGE
ncbi:M23 family metallopeptidase [Paenibacillus aquistagni]|uniref:M23 family metallopeptidase n=1 Tax=Paenibacillus aquistagni TaxID=1852522 RepID=UPI002165D8B1|nr:M23 family metallopeptidase [Paenibacillus aquistagni]